MADWQQNKRDSDGILWDADGLEIERESFRRIEAEAGELRTRFSEQEWHVARRLVHTTADFSILESLEFHGEVVEAGLEALRRGVLIYSDSNMIKAGLSVPKLQRLHTGYAREGILCPIMEPAVAEYAKAHHLTRALAGVTLHREQLSEAVILCGNAPLALASIARMCRDEGLRPALIIGMPVGFVNVIESKQMLSQVTDVPWLRLNGRRGGSPLAVAALHGIMECG
ncbi:MAG: precorrin-8X methylmutase [Victivallales bacterium]|nr:precorrin-8X methylmutase [Victivallales bacterium]